MKTFPVQQDTEREIPFEVAEEVYKEYHAKYGGDQSLKRLGERGGFGKIEAIKLLFDRIQRIQNDSPNRGKLKK